MSVFKRGITLLELLIVSAILIGAILGIWGTFITILNCTIQAQELNIVSDDLGDVFEKLKNVPFSDVTKVFDASAETDGGGNPVENGTDAVSQNSIGGFILQSESISIRYPQITSTILVSDLPDPLEIEVTLTWMSKASGAQSKTMKTIRASVL